MMLMFICKHIERYSMYFLCVHVTTALTVVNKMREVDRGDRPGLAARGRLRGPNVGSEDATEDSNLPRRLAAQKFCPPVSLYMQPTVTYR